MIFTRNRCLHFRYAWNVAPPIINGKGNTQAGVVHPSEHKRTQGMERGANSSIH